MRRVQCFAVLAAFSVGAVCQPSFVPLQQPSPSIRVIGFEVSPPKGDGWFMLDRNEPGQLTFRKLIPVRTDDPQGPSSTFVVEIKAERYRQHDLSDPKGLESALRFALFEETERFTYAPLRTSPFTWQGTDCLRYQSSREERDVAMPLAMRRVWEVDGYFCRHPSNPMIAVTGLMQQQRLSGAASFPDDRLRAEAEDTLQSVRFLPIR